MTASIHRLHPASDPSIERLRDAARTLSRMPENMATAIEVVGLELPASILSIVARGAADEFGVVADIRTEPVPAVRFERA